MQKARAFGEVLGNLREHVEEFLFPGDQSHLSGRPVLVFSSENALLSHAGAEASIKGVAWVLGL